MTKRRVGLLTLWLLVGLALTVMLWNLPALGQGVVVFLQVPLPPHGTTAPEGRYCDRNFLLISGYDIQGPYNPEYVCVIVSGPWNEGYVDAFELLSWSPNSGVFIPRTNPTGRDRICWSDYNTPDMTNFGFSQQILFPRINTSMTYPIWIEGSGIVAKWYLSRPEDYVDFMYAGCPVPERVHLPVILKPVILK